MLGGRFSFTPNKIGNGMEKGKQFIWCPRARERGMQQKELTHADDMDKYGKYLTALSTWVLMIVLTLPN